MPRRGFVSDAAGARAVELGDHARARHAIRHVPLERLWVAVTERALHRRDQAPEAREEVHHAEHKDGPLDELHLGLG